MHGTTARSTGLFVDTANDSPSHHFICVSSCTEPQECCCERSEQQQTCLIVRCGCLVKANREHLKLPAFELNGISFSFVLAFSAMCFPGFLTYV